MSQSTSTPLPAAAKTFSAPAASVTSARGPHLVRAGSLGRKFLVAVLLVAGLIWAGRYAQHLLTHAETDDAFITSAVHLLSPHISGTVTAVLVEQNTLVKAGDPLFRLDPRDHAAKVEQATAQLAQSHALMTYSRAQIAASTAKIDEGQANLTKAQLDFERTDELVRNKVASRQEFDAAKAALDSARASLRSAQAAAESTAAGLQVAEAQRQNSQAMLDNAQLQLSYNLVTAPVSGLTSKRSVEVGAYVQPGQALLAIVEPGLWIEANFKETQLAKMRVGQTADVTIDAIPGQHFRAQVASFAPASGAQFALLPPDNATGNFTKVVQRVPVRLTLDATSLRGFAEKLRPGLSAVVSVQLD